MTMPEIQLKKGGDRQRKNKDLLDENLVFSNGILRKGG
jgi:hypothetical protein